MIADASSPSKKKDFFCLATTIDNEPISKELAVSFRSSMESDKFQILSESVDIKDNQHPSSFSGIIISNVSSNLESKSNPCHTVSVLSSSSVKPPLPINYDAHLPHLNFNIGQESDTSFKINVAYDTCAVLNVGYSGYHLTIAKAFPSVVKALTWAKQDYSPLVLSGIVSDENNNPMSSDQKPSSKTTTSLPATIEYYTPYVTKEGSPVTFKVALGNNVGVNTIMGLSTIKNAKMSLDLDAGVFEAGILSCDPFDIIFKPTSRGIPDLSTIKAHPLGIKLSKASEASINVNAVIECYDAEFKEAVNDTISKDNNNQGSINSMLESEAESKYPFFG